MKVKKILLSVIVVFALILGLNTVTLATEEAEPVTLQSKIAAITKAGEITLDKDYEESIEIPEGKDVTINLAGHKIIATSGHAIRNKGNLTVKDTGLIQAQGKQSGAVVNHPGATARLIQGTYESQHWYAIKNMGNMTIEGIDFKNGPDTSSLVVNGWYGSAGNDDSVPYNSNGAKMIINGGLFITTGDSCNVVKNDDGGNLTINGGTFKTDAANVIQNWNIAKITGGTFISTSRYVIANGNCDDQKDKGELTITGGTFNGASNVSMLADNGGSTKDKGKLTISGGTFNGTLGENIAHNYAVEISGGTYSHEIDKTVIKSGYQCKEAADKYVVSKIKTGGGSSSKPSSTEKPEETSKPSKVEVVVPTVDTTSQVNEVKAGVTNSAETKTILEDSLVKAMAKDKELANKVANKSVQVKVQIENNIKDKIANEVKTKMQEAIAKKSTNAKILDYFNINIAVLEGNKSVAEMSELTKSIKITVSIPEGIEKVKDGFKRTFYVIREHDNSMTVLDTQVAKDGKTLTFESDKFSTYSLAYTDTEVKTTTQEANVGTTNTVTSSTAPKTGDNIALYAVVILSSIIGIAIVVIIKKVVNR